MALTLEEMAVHFSANGDKAVVSAFGTIDTASKKARTSITDTFVIGANNGAKFVKKMESVGTQTAFAFSQIAASGEASFKSVASGMSQIGFLAGPLVGALTTLAAVLATTVVDSFFKARKEAKELNDKLLELNRTIGESGSLMQAAKRSQQLFSGDQFISDSDPLAKLIRGGGLEGAKKDLAALQAQAAALKPGTGANFDVEAQERYNAKMAELSPKIATATANVALLQKEMAPLNKMVADFAKKQGAQDANALALAQEKRAEATAQYEHDLAVRTAGLENNYAEQLRLTVEWVDQMAAKYGTDSDQYRHALDAKLAFTGETNTDLKKLNDDALKKIEDDWKTKLDLEAKGNAALTTLAKERAGRAAEINGELMATMRRALDAATANANAAVAKQNEAANKILSDQTARVEQAADILGNALTSGLTAAIEGGGVGGAFKAFGSVILASLGGILQDMGKALIVTSGVFQALLPALSNVFTAGPAMAIAGAALLALGGTLSAIATRSGGAGGGGGASSYTAGPTSTTSFTTVAPYEPAPGTQATTRGMTATAPVVVNATIIGKDDPSAQRQLMDLFGRAQLRMAGGG